MGSSSNTQPGGPERFGGTGTLSLYPRTILLASGSATCLSNKKIGRSYSAIVLKQKRSMEWTESFSTTGRKKGSNRFK